MRLFIGIDLPDTVKSTLSSTRDFIDTGRHVSEDNYHITLVYLGETSDRKKATLHQSLKTLTPSLSSFNVSLEHIGTFKKGTTHIVYVDVMKTDALNTLQSTIKSLVEELGFSVDTRPYNPHITLARKVQTVPNIKPIHTTVHINKITLFLSHRVNGELTYTPIETYLLEPETVL